MSAPMNGADVMTLMRRASYGGRKGRRAVLRLEALRIFDESQPRTRRGRYRFGCR